MIITNVNQKRQAGGACDYQENTRSYINWQLAPHLLLLTALEGWAKFSSKQQSSVIDLISDNYKKRDAP